ncbi:uncharacterized protein LOC111117668 [Crassostrea virginica]
MKIIYLTISLSGLITTLAYDDLSYNKDASQSHTFSGLGYGAGNAVDGNTATCMRTMDIGQNSPRKTVWWKVDLGGLYNIYSVNILFKNYDGYESRQQGRFAGYSLYISNTGDRDSSSLCYKDGPELPPLNFTTTCRLSGRYVIFYNERLDGVIYPAGYELVANVYTELCEVTVNGCSKPGVYGSNCNIPCPKNCRYRTCHIQNGTCFGCEAGYKGTICATECPDERYSFDCKQQCSGHCRDNEPCNKSVATEPMDTVVLTTVVVTVCTTLHVTNRQDTVTEDVNPDIPMPYVAKVNSKIISKHYCFKNKCSSGTYGKDCTNKCSEYCLHNKSCNHIDGTCTERCQNGYGGNICNISCEHGRYGKNCSQVCSLNCKTCRHTDGTCSCHAGWSGPNCSIGCTNSYGENCQYLCHPLCANQTCDRFDGTCAIASKIGGLEIYEHSGSNQKGETWTAGLSVSIGFNAFLLAVVLFLLWRHYRKVHSGAIKSCWESSLYEKSTHIDVPDPTYQELDVKENPYQNTTIN